MCALTIFPSLLHCDAQLFASGQCGCLDYDLTQGDDYETVYNRLDMIDDVMGDASADTKRQVVELICGSAVNDGDHLQVRSVPAFCSPTHHGRTGNC